MALRHAAVFRNPGSYVASPASSSATLIWRRSTARIVPSWMGSSYCLPVRLSVTDRVLFAAFIKLGSNLAPIGAIAESAPSEMDPDFQPSGALMDKLASAIDESRARVSQDLILYRTERPVKRLAGRIAVIIDGQVTYPWRGLAAAKVAEQLGAKQVVIATPVGTQAAADRVAARRYDFVCPSIVMDAQGHPAPYGDVAGETPERLRSIMIAHQAA